MTGPFDFSNTVLLANMNVFADAVAYTPQNAVVPYDARGIFDEAYQELVVIDGEAVTVKMPVLGIRLEEFQTLPQQGDQLIVRGNNYMVREARNDSHGGMKLMLNRVDA